MGLVICESVGRINVTVLPEGSVRVSVIRPPLLVDEVNDEGEDTEPLLLLEAENEVVLDTADDDDVDDDDTSVDEVDESTDDSDIDVEEADNDVLCECEVVIITVPTDDLVEGTTDPDKLVDL